MKFLSYIYCFSFFALTNYNSAYAIQTGEKKVQVKSQKMLVIREADVSNAKVFKSLQNKFGNFFKQLKQSAQTFETKLQQDLVNVKKGSPEHEKLKKKFENYREKVAQLEAIAQEKMENAMESVKDSLKDAFEKISAKYGNRPIYKMESVFAFFPDESDEFVDITGELIELLDKTKRDIPVELPIIQL